MFSFKKLQFINSICLIQYISLKIIPIYFVFLKIKSLNSSSSHWLVGKKKYSDNQRTKEPLKLKDIASHSHLS